jgi:transcriptional regulator with XRE-family HTH domain
MSEQAYNLGKAITELRTFLDLTIPEAASHASLHENTAAKIESGELPIRKTSFNYLKTLTDLAVRKTAELAGVDNVATPTTQVTDANSIRIYPEQAYLGDLLKELLKHREIEQKDLIDCLPSNPSRSLLSMILSGQRRWHSEDEKPILNILGYTGEPIGEDRSFAECIKEMYKEPINHQLPLNTYRVRG